MAYSVYAIRLTENLSETPEKYLHFRNAVIARTGSQTYKGAELPQRTEETPKDEITMQDLGIGPNDDIDLYRPSEEVFAPHTIASFEGKVITNEHPADLIDIDSHKDHDCGHIVNVHPGKEPLPNGDMPLLADGFITDNTLKTKILSGLRDLSCGYNYRIARDGNRVLQVDIIGNHVAVVPNGRAGNAAIFDSATGKVIDVPVKKSILWGTNPMANFKDKMIAIGLKAFAVDAKPEEMEQAMVELTRPVVIGKAKGVDGHPEGCMCSKCPSAKDATGAEKETVKEEGKEIPAEATTDAAKMAKDSKRKKFHDALDKHLDMKDATEKTATENSEADMNELKSLFKASDEEDTPMEIAGEDANEHEVEQEHTVKEEEAEESEGKAEDEEISASSPIIEPINRNENPVPGATDKRAMDAARQQGAVTILKTLRPVIAASKDRAVQKAFDAIAREINKQQKPLRAKGTGTYGGVVSGAAARDTNTSEKTAAQLATTANDAYKAARARMEMVPTNLNKR